MNIQAIEDQPNTWAALVGKNFEPGVIFKAKNKVNRDPRRTKSQQSRYQIKRMEEMQQNLVDTSLQEVQQMMKDVKDVTFHMFRDVYDWNTIEYVCHCENLEKLVDSGSDLPWWHGYNFEKDMVVQFKYDENEDVLDVKCRLNLDKDYISSVQQAIPK